MVTLSSPSKINAPAYTPLQVGWQPHFGAGEPKFGSRGREMLVEDFIGFGLLRSVMDLFRGYFYGSGELNIPAARERVLREACSILTDNVSYGLAAFGLGALLDRKMNGYSNRFSNFASVELFRDLAAQSPDEQAFLKKLAGSLGDTSPEKTVIWEKALAGWWNQLEKVAEKDLKTTLKAQKGPAAIELAKQLKLDSFDIKVAAGSFRVDELLEDLGFLKGHLKTVAGKKVDVPWNKLAADTLSKTLKIKYAKLACLGVGVVSTFAVPFFNQWLTQKIDKIDYYPGEIGLQNNWQPVATAAGSRKAPPAMFTNSQVFNRFTLPSQSAPTKPKSWFEEKCPYVADSIKRGNWWPVIIAALPLPVFLGAFNTVTRRFFNPFKPGFLKTLRNAYDFEKEGPFTTQQQMASMFALLITSRLLNARSPNEYRERMVDSFAGWLLWILGTPFIKKKVAEMWDPNLLKQVGNAKVLRTAAEVDLLPKAVQEITAQRLKKLGRWSTIASMFLLGVVEPYLAIMWTKKNAQDARTA